MVVNGERKDQSGQTEERGLKVVHPSTPTVPDPEVIDRAARRRFIKEEKARILREADQCKRGERGALLRRKGIYSSTLAKWRKQREKALAQWVEPQPPGPKPAEPQTLEARVAELEQENARLQRQLKQAETIIEVQKKSPRSWRFL